MDDAGADGRWQAASPTPKAQASNRMPRGNDRVAGMSRLEGTVRIFARDRSRHKGRRSRSGTPKKKEAVGLLKSGRCRRTMALQLWRGSGVSRM